MYLILVGTRAQLIKMAPVIREMAVRRLDYRFVLTGQHRETMEELISCFDLRSPDDVLVEGMESDSFLKLAIWLLRAGIAVFGKPYFNSRHTTAVIVHGDTLSTLFGAVMARLRGIPVVHVEAGLRSFNKLDPFPEEIIRIAVSRLARVHCCPGDWACNNLAGIRGIKVNSRENTLMDATYFATRETGFDSVNDRYAVVSIHRHENLSKAARFEQLIDCIISLSSLIDIRFVLHPVTRKKLQSSGKLAELEQVKSITLLERMDYISFVRLLYGARVLMTDGGSNQEEAHYLKIPCVLLRKHTERREGLDDNVLLSGLDDDRIRAFVIEHLDADRKAPEIEVRPSGLIVEKLESIFQDGGEALQAR